MSSKIKSGSIPKKIKMFCRPLRVVKFKWDDIEVDDEVALVACHPTFVADLENKKTQETGRTWADRASYEWDAELCRSIQVNLGFDMYERNNDPISDVRVIGLDVRGNGGRAWQVVFDEKYLFDMREDVLMDAILSGGILEGGYLSGEYIFAAVNSEMKIIRVGSLLHTKMIESTEYNKKVAITGLEVGGIYQNKVSTKLYLGRLFHTPTIVHTDYNRASYYFGSGASSGPTYSIRIGEVRSGHVFLELYNQDDTSSEDVNAYKESLCRTYGTTFSKDKPKSFKNKVGQLKFDNIEALLETIKSIVVENKSKDKDVIKYAYDHSTLNLSVTKDAYIHPKILEEIQEIKDKG